MRDDKSFQAHSLQSLQSVDTMLLGANTYRMFSAYWPGAAEEVGEYAVKLNSLTRYVVSSTLTAAPWGQWAAAHIISADVVENVAKLKASPGGDIVLWGSLPLSYELMRNGLVDEIQLRMCPAALGAGLPVFADQINLELVEVRPFDKGMVLLRYEPER